MAGDPGNFPELLEKSSKVSETSLIKSHHGPPGVNYGHNCPQINKQVTNQTNRHYSEEKVTLLAGVTTKGGRAK